SRCTFEELRYSRPFISTLGKIRSYVGQPQKLLEVCISCRFFYLERALGKFCNMTTKCCCTMSSQTQAREANKGHSHQIRNAMPNRKVLVSTSTYLDVRKFPFPYEGQFPLKQQLAARHSAPQCVREQQKGYSFPSLSKLHIDARYK
ncbi:unnamed protein product, partial [Callosobruchus maculatus]